MNDQGTEGKIDETKGKAKEAWGNVTGDEDTKAEGKVDQAEGNVRQGVDKLGDAVGNITDKS